MWVMSCRVFLQMRGVEDIASHQRLKDEGLVEEHTPTMGSSAYVSCEWDESARGPDPTFARFARLQALMRASLAGEGFLPREWVVDGSVWIPFLCVPQLAKFWQHI